MKQLLWVPLSLSATLISSISLTASITLNCPPHITTEQHVKTLPAGWSAGTDIAYLTPKKEHLLAGVGFYSGPPQEGAVLAPDQTTKRRKNVSNLWKLDSATEKYWFACRYAQTTVLLTQQLPAQPMHCTAEYTGDSLVPVNLSCTASKAAAGR